MAEVAAGNADRVLAEVRDRGIAGRMSGAELTVGAVAYHPRIVTIWERFRSYFADAGVPTRLRLVLQLRAARRRSARRDGRCRRWSETACAACKPAGSTPLPLSTSPTCTPLTSCDVLLWRRPEASATKRRQHERFR